MRAHFPEQRLVIEPKYICVANLSERIFTLEEIFAGKMCVVIFICEFILIIYINLNSFIIITFLTRCRAVAEEFSICHHINIRGSLRLPFIFWTEIFWNRLTFKKTYSCPNE